MGLFRQRRDSTTVAESLIPSRGGRRVGTAVVTNETALRHSAVWACLRLRSNLVGTMPVDAYRDVDGICVQVPKPPILATPGGERVGINEWMYSTQMDLDRGGNAFGLITERNGLGLPARIDLVPLSDVSVKTKGGEIEYYRIGGEKTDPARVWHEKQYTIAGLPVGLSPVAYAAWSIGEYLSIQDFAAGWFGDGGVPRAHLRNTARVIDENQASGIKAKFKQSIQSGDLFVTGKDWEYDMIQAQQSGTEWIEAKRFGVGDVARFFDCPGDLIDAAVSTGNITYANITQRNLQFLIMHLGPAIIRRENALSGLLPRPRYVKLNTDALLRMDPETRAAVIAQRIASRQLAPSEGRALEELPPFTESQMAEFDRFWPAKAAAPITQPKPIQGAV